MANPVFLTEEAIARKIVPDYSTSATYEVGEIVLHDGVAYKCTTAVTTAGEWTGSTSWTAATDADLANRLKGLKSDGKPTDDFAISIFENTAADIKANTTSLAPAFDATKTYAVDEVVTHDGNIYQCKTAIAEGGEAWNPAHWELMKLSDFFTESTGFTPPERVAGALKNSMLEKSIVLAVTENFADADTTSYGSAT